MDQSNFLSASGQFESLRKYLNENADVKTLIAEFGMTEVLRKRVKDKQRKLEGQIGQNIIDLVFMSSKERCSQKINTLQKYLDIKLSKLEKEQDILEYVCKEMNEIKKTSDQIVKIHKREVECSGKAQELIDGPSSSDESVSTGLLCLQRDSKKAIEDQNVAYLTLLVISFLRVSDDSVSSVSLICL